MSITQGMVVLCTAPDEACLQELVAKIPTEKLAACATLAPDVTSLYYRERKLEQEYEVQILLKSNVGHQEALLAGLKAHHPYQTPELLVLPVAHGNSEYFSWPYASLR